MNEQKQPPTAQQEETQVNNQRHKKENSIKFSPSHVRRTKKRP